MINFSKSFILSCVVLIAAQVLDAQPGNGKKAIEISLPSVSGDTLRLSSLEGKIVLVDFWASWCGPCRNSNRELVKMYSKYKNKGFEIFAVSLDQSKEAWKKAIKKDKMTWQQVIDDGGQHAITPIQWNIYSIPTSYLVDKEGKLVAMDLTPKELERILKDLL